MVLLKVLGMLDLASAFAFLMLIFGIQPYTPYLLFCAGLLVVKGMFILTGDVLSVIDLFAALFLILSIFFFLPALLLWTSAFLLLAKGMVSFI